MLSIWSGPNFVVWEWVKSFLFGKELKILKSIENIFVGNGENAEAEPALSNIPTLISKAFVCRILTLQDLVNS